MPEIAALDRQPGAALRHVEGVGDADHAGLERVGLAAAAVADDAVEDLGDDHRQLGLLVEPSSSSRSFGSARKRL